MEWPLLSVTEEGSDDGRLSIIIIVVSVVIDDSIIRCPAGGGSAYLLMPRLDTSTILPTTMPFYHTRYPLPFLIPLPPTLFLLVLLPVTYLVVVCHLVPHLYPFLPLPTMPCSVSYILLYCYPILTWFGEGKDGGKLPCGILPFSTTHAFPFYYPFTCWWLLFSNCLYRWKIPYRPFCILIPLVLFYSLPILLICSHLPPRCYLIWILPFVVVPVTHDLLYLDMQECPIYLPTSLYSTPPRYYSGGRFYLPTYTLCPPTICSTMGREEVGGRPATACLPTLFPSPLPLLHAFSVSITFGSCWWWGMPPLEFTTIPKFGPTWKEGRKTCYPLRLRGTYFAWLPFDYTHSFISLSIFAHFALHFYIVRI